MEIALLGLHSRAQDFVRICGAGGADFAQERCGEDAKGVSAGALLVVGGGGGLAHFEAGELLFEVLVERELDRDVCES